MTSDAGTHAGRVLVVQPDDSSLKEVTEFLQAEGFCVVGCTTCSEALALLEAGDFSTLIVDPEFVDEATPEHKALSSKAMERSGLIHYPPANEVPSLAALQLLANRVYRALLTRQSALLANVEAELQRRKSETEERIRHEMADRARAEVELIESRRAMETLLSNLPGMAYRCLNDADWTMKFVSDGCKALTGYDAVDLLDNRQIAYAEIMHPDDVQWVADAVRERVENDQPFEFEYRIIDASGVERWVWERGRLVRDSNEYQGTLEGFICDISERKRTERALRGSESKYRSIFDRSPEMVVLLNTDGYLLDVNDMAEGLFGYDKSEFIGSHFTDLRIWSEKTKHRAIDIFERRRLEDDIAPYEIELIRKDGQLLTCRVHAAVLKNDAGEITEILLMVSDVTEQRRAEQVLRDSEEKFRIVAEQSPEMIIIYRGGRIVYANAPCEQVMGYSKEEYQADDFDFRQVFAPECLADLAAGLQQHAEGKELVTGEYTLITHEGRKIEVIISSRKILYAGEEALLGVVTDITKRKRAERELARREHELSVVYDAAPAIMLLLDEDYKIRRSNLAAMEASGYTTAESVVGKRQGELLRCIHALADPNGCGFGPDCQKCGIRSMVFETFRTNSGLYREEQKIAFDRGGVVEERYMVASTVPLSLDDQPHILLTLEDTTDRVIAGKLLREHETEMAHLQRVHTVGELAATLAHELNQPLYAINNYVGGIRRRLQKAGHGQAMTVELTDVMDNVANEVSRAAGIVTHLREFIRNRQPEFSSVNLHEILEDAIQLMEPSTRNNGVDISRTDVSGLPLVWADRVQIEQVVVNLLQNALDAVTEERRERKTVEVRADTSGRNVRVSIRDAGCGIPPEIADKVFDPYTTNKEHGLGVGLAISRSIIVAHGGQIWAEPNEPYGTVFRFTVPCTEI